MQKNLLTIGQLSKLTGVAVKALRYYESIGILKPSQINAATGYRYYSPSYITYVQVIKICVRYGLPLKDFSAYRLDDQQIDMAKLLSDAKLALAHKQAELDQDNLYLKELDQQLHIANQLDHEKRHHLEEADGFYLLVPFEGELFSALYYQAVQALKGQINASGLTNLNQYGLYYKRTNKGTWATALLAAIHQGKGKDALPGATCLCWRKAHVHAVHVTQGGLQAQLDLLAQKGIGEVMVLETYESPYRLDDPHVEVRYRLLD